MGKVKIGNPELKNKHTGSPVESAFSKQEMLEIAKNVMEKYSNTFKKLAETEKKQKLCQCVPVKQVATKDKRARQYVKALRKFNKKQNDFLLAKTVNIQKSVEENKEVVSRYLNASKNSMQQFDKDLNKVAHTIELIEQELKVKPVHIKETKVVERFDHRLVIFNLILLFTNICLLLKTVI